MGVTGVTDNKLFKIRSYDPNQPYKVGLNGVTEVNNETIESVNYDVIKYEIDGIKYTTYIKNGNNDIFNLTDSNSITNISVKISNNYKFSNVSAVNQGDLNLLSLDKTNNVRTKKTSKNSDKVFLRTPLSPDNIQTKNLVTRRKNKDNSIFLNGDTLFETTDFSYKQYVDKKITKKEDYVGLIDKPIVKPQIFMERDAFAIMERQQRISEINSLFDLENYKNGYYKNVKTI